MIEQQTINGRKAAVAYLDDSLQPASKESYTYARILYDDDGGNSSTLVKRPPVAAPGGFNPEKLGRLHANAWNAHREKQRREHIAPPPALPPLDTAAQRKRVDDWGDAIATIDATEPALRDLIERELANIAAVSGTKYFDAMKSVTVLRQRIAALRIRAIKKAFRKLRDTAP